MSAAQPRPPMTQIVSLSARSTPNLVALGMSLATGWILGSLWVVILGSWLYVLLVARQSTSRLYWRALAEREAERARQLPAESTLTDPALMLIVRALRHGYDEIARVLRETPPVVKTHLGLAVASLDDVRAQAAQLVRDADMLSRYLLTGPAEATQAAIERMSQEITRATDEGVKTEYQRALSVRQDQQAAVAQVQREHARIVAALQFIVGTIEAFPAWIYRMSVLESRAKDDRVSTIDEELLGMKTELGLAQQLLEGLGRPERLLESSDEPRNRVQDAR